MFTRPHKSQAKRQRGAAAILFGIVALLLFGFMTLVIDLGRTYVVRTELQNAADAASLAGARQLDQTVAGVTRGVAHAIAMAAQNNVQFSTPIIITADNISVGSCPDDGCMVAASTVTTNGAAAGMTFMRVNIASGGLATFFARLPFVAGGTGTDTMNTFGRAVAGRFVNNITPIAVCARDSREGVIIPPVNELVQFGFRRGLSYNLLEGESPSNSVVYLLNPVDSPPNSCSGANNSAAFVAPFICTGSSAVLAASASFVYGNSGLEAINQWALNSRFGLYGAGNNNVCIVEQAPPDANITEYPFDTNNWPPPGQQGLPERPIWHTAQQWQTFKDSLLNMDPFTNPSAANEHGVIWSYSRAVSGVGSSPNARPGASFSVTDWGALYNGVSPNATYPSSGSPYEAVVTNAHGMAGRRVLNLVIADCSPGAVSGSGSCSTVPALGIGRFFLQRRVRLGGSDPRFDVEFAGLVEPIPTAEIKLYR